MLRIICPCCGADAEETEYACGGEGHIRRPDPAEASDGDWAEYLSRRTNPMGPHLERWQHVAGCGKWFHLARNTVTQVVYGAYSIRDAQPPEEILRRMDKDMKT